MYLTRLIHDSHAHARPPRPGGRVTRRGLAAVLVACAALGIAFPAFARADSVAFVRAGDVWLATGDFTREYRVTFTGGYSDVSQADDGTLIALKGVRLHRLDRAGAVLADFDTPVSDTRPPGSRVFYGPFDPSVSPDGTKVAYTYYYMTQSQNGTCFPPTCVTTINEGGTGYSHADRQTGWDEAGFGKHSGWRFPTWVDDATTILSNPTHLPNFDVVVDRPGERAGAFMAKNWFSDAVEGNPGVGSSDITRDRSKLAFQTGTDYSTLTVYAVGSFPTVFKDGASAPGDRPGVCYRYSGPAGGRFGPPTFSPDGGRLAFAEGDGVHVVTVPSLAAGCTLDGASPTTGPAVIPNAIEPDWGPAPVPPSRPDPSTAGQGGASPGAGGGTAAAARIAAPRRARLRSALRTGLLVRIIGARPGRITVQARAGRTRVAAGTARVKADGTASVRLRFTKVARRRLASKRTVKLAISAPGLRPASVTLAR